MDTPSIQRKDWDDIFTLQVTNVINEYVLEKLALANIFTPLGCLLKDFSDKGISDPENNSVPF